MALAVNNNTSAFNVFASYTGNIGNMKKSMARLSTGVKSVTDDPSGVGISERMRSQIRSTGMARQNVENGVSLLQTADSWMQKINDMLGRMHELGVEASDGTKTDTDKTNIQSEFKELQGEIGRITSHSAAAGKYNGLYLFRGGNGRGVAAGDAMNTGSITIQIGADVGQTVGLDVKNLQVTNTENIGTVSTYTYSSDNSVMTSTHTGVTWASVVDTGKMSVGHANSIGKIATAIDHIANARATLGAQQNRLEQTSEGLIAYEDNLRSAESKVRDVDMASESTRFSKYQILSQISNAMLAQANQIPSSSLQLLG
jgi:flagellin